MWVYLKRPFDVTVSAVLLGLLLPLFLLTAIVIRVTCGSPVLFVQERPGLYGKAFRLVKFRTMRHQLPGDENLLTDAQCLSWFGRTLRASSLDELPELWNVLCGDMSLVGPRPLLMEYLGLYTPQQARRHEVRPGITGLAQVNGRNLVDWERRFEFDIWYVDHVSFWMDVKIIGRTIVRVVSAKGISQHGEATMQRFRGGQA